MTTQRVRDRRFEAARKKLHAMLDTLEWAAKEHDWYAHPRCGCPAECLEGKLAQTRSRLLREIIREFGGRA